MSATDSHARPASYFKQYTRSVDRARVILPTEWRTPLHSKELYLVEWPLGAPECLAVLTPARWEKVMENITEQNFGDEEAAMVVRELGKFADASLIDDYGRLHLPEESMRKLNIGSEVLLAGCINKFEVWSVEAHKAKEAKADPEKIRNAFSKIKL